MKQTRRDAGHEQLALGPFAGCNREQRAWARRRLTPMYYDAGSVLLEAGTRAAEVILIASGQVDVHEKDLRVRRVGRGAVVGESDVLTGRLGSVTIVAVDPVQAYLVSAREFLHLVSNVAPLARNVLIDVCARQAAA